MYQSMSEIKKKQRIINRRIQELMKLHEEQCQQCANGDSKLMEALKSEIYLLNRKLKKLLEIQERHNHYWPDDHHQNKYEPEHKDKEDKKEEPKLEFETSSKSESSSCADSKMASSLKEKPVVVKTVPEIALKPAMELKDEPGGNEEHHQHHHHREHNHDHDHNQPKPEPPSQQSQLFGFAYTRKGSDKSGVVKLQIAGPLHEGVSLTSKGLKVNKSGVYQINYTVSLEAMVQTEIPTSFELNVNDSIVIESSLTQTTTSDRLSTSVLFSLLSGDVVMLVAQLATGVVYTSANLQILQVG